MVILRLLRKVVTSYSITMILCFFIILIIIILLISIYECFSRIQFFYFFYFLYVLMTSPSFGRCYSWFDSLLYILLEGLFDR